MFYGCKSLEDIKSLENWNVSKSNNFSYMFYNCESLKDISPFIFKRYFSFILLECIKL